MIENATSNGVRPVTYMFEVASDPDFNTKVYARSGVPAGDNGRTSVQIDRLDLGRAYYWRAKADDGANSSQFSSAQFEVLPKPLLNRAGARLAGQQRARNVAPPNADGQRFRSQRRRRRPVLRVPDRDRSGVHETGGGRHRRRRGRPDHIRGG